MLPRTFCYRGPCLTEDHAVLPLYCQEPCIVEDPVFPGTLYYQRVAPVGKLKTPREE